MDRKESRIDVRQAAELAECSTRHIQKIIKRGVRGQTHKSVRSDVTL